MLHAVAQLAQHGVGHVQLVLRHEVRTHTLGAHQAHHRLDALDQGGRRMLEQQVGFIKEEQQFGLVQVTHLGQGSHSFDSLHGRKVAYRRGAFISLSAATWGPHLHLASA
jgi:hypothetical protein